MTPFQISRVFPLDRQANQKVDALLQKEGIQRDTNLDYTCAIYDGSEIIATGSIFSNTLRCLAVSDQYQGEGLLNKIVSHLINYQYEKGIYHLFLYTKIATAAFFETLGFTEIAHIDGFVSFMENKKTGFADYLNKLEKTRQEYDKVAAIVVNANPFTLGHQFLIEKASQENDILHLFIISEDTSLVPFSVRKDLVKKGTAHLNNIIYHDTDSYIISNSTFPAYFQKDTEAVIESQARLDLEIFGKIAAKLGINRRYVGEEPTSLVTNLYNQIMAKELSSKGVECLIIPRKTSDHHKIISASTARQAIKDNDWNTLKELLPKTSLDYFASEEAKPVINKIRQEKNVIHY